MTPVSDSHDVRVLVKPPTDRDPQWVVTAHQQPYPRAAWQSLAQASGDSFAAALRAAADLIDERDV